MSGGQSLETSGDAAGAMKIAPQIHFWPFPAADSAPFRKLPAFSHRRLRNAPSARLSQTQSRSFAPLLSFDRPISVQKKTLMRPPNDVCCRSTLRTLQKSPNSSLFQPVPVFYPRGRGAGIWGNCRLFLPRCMLSIPLYSSQTAYIVYRKSPIAPIAHACHHLPFRP